MAKNNPTPVRRILSPTQEFKVKVIDTDRLDYISEVEVYGMRYYIRTPKSFKENEIKPGDEVICFKQRFGPHNTKLRLAIKDNDG
jgi:hypothetical protein